MANAQQAVTALRAGMPLDQVMQRYRLLDSGSSWMPATPIPARSSSLRPRRNSLRASTRPRPRCTAVRYQTDPPKRGCSRDRDARTSHAGAGGLCRAADKVWTDYKIDAQTRVREANVRYLRSRADILLSPDARALEAHAK